MALLSKFTPSSYSSSLLPNNNKIIYKRLHMAHSSSSSSSPSIQNISSISSSSKKKRKLPILLFDIMDTIVRDPFYHDVPNFFRMSFKDLIDSKHPTAWADFEKGQINEMELGEKFFLDCRPLDMEGLKNCMKSGYTYLEGIEALLHNLKQNDYELHAFTNYPEWYSMIEEKLRISNYLSWTFCSCNIGKRKPDPDAYLDVLRHLEVDPSSCIFIDDRLVNVEAARNVGMSGIHFKNATALEQELSVLGVEFCSINKEDTETQIKT